MLCSVPLARVSFLRVATGVGVYVTALHATAQRSRLQVRPEALPARMTPFIVALSIRIVARTCGVSQLCATVHARACSVVLDLQLCGCKPLAACGVSCCKFRLVQFTIMDLRVLPSSCECNTVLCQMPEARGSYVAIVAALGLRCSRLRALRDSSCARMSAPVPVYFDV